MFYKIRECNINFFCIKIDIANNVNIYTIVHDIYIYIGGKHNIMFLFDKYIPENPCELHTNVNIMSELLNMSAKSDIPNIIISGPPGSGKKTIAKFFLESIYDPSVHKTRPVSYSITTSSYKTDISVEQSDYHIVIDPINTNRDKYILQDVIKQYVSKKSFALIFAEKTYKTIIINNIDILTSHSQCALRRTMEKYAAECRFIVICNTISKVNCALRSRCRTFCTSLPTLKKANEILSYVSIMENIKVSRKEIEEYLDIHGTDIRGGMWFLQCKQLNIDPNILLDNSFDSVVKYIMTASDTTNPKTLTTTIFDTHIRTELYNIIVANIEKSLIISSIMNRLLVNVEDPDKCYRIIKATSKADFNLVHGRRDIIHLDYYIGMVISILRS